LYDGPSSIKLFVTYVIVFQAPVLASVAIQHFIGFNPNSSWLLPSPSPSVSIQQAYIETPITSEIESKIITVIVTDTLLLDPHQGFGLCASIQDTNQNTIYQHITCMGTLI